VLLIAIAGVQSFLMINLTYKIGSAATDAATALKVVEKGLGKGDFAVAILVNFPIQIIFGYLITRWSHRNQPLHPWIWAVWPHFLFVLLAVILLWRFPKPPITTGFFIFLLIFHSFAEMPGQVCFFTE
jgi:PAT family acetyl-CoA transporter-like MFS transporter 1